jgi:hypothetical protein
VTNLSAPEDASAPVIATKPMHPIVHPTLAPIKAWCNAYVPPPPA